eukprot:511741-Prorocentrum_minimum.AAC.7
MLAFRRTIQVHMGVGGLTPLQRACFAGYDQVVDALLRAGADIEARAATRLTCWQCGCILVRADALLSTLQSPKGTLTWCVCCWPPVLTRRPNATYAPTFTRPMQMCTCYPVVADN